MRYLVAFMLLIFTACAPAPVYIIVTATPELTITEVAQQPTNTQLPSPNSTTTPTLTTTPTTTFTVTTTNTLTPSATLITITEQPTPTQEIVRVVYAQSEGLRIRSFPSVSTGAILAEVARNTPLIVFNADADSRVGVQGQWLTTTTPDGTQGFVAGWLVDFEPVTIYSTAPYFVGVNEFNSIHTLRTSWAGNGERIQVQQSGDCFWHVKGHTPGNNNYEAFLLLPDGIYRVYDTSPFENAVYATQSGFKPMRWLPREMAVGDSIFFPMTAHWYRKDNGNPFVPPGAPSNIIPFGHVIQLVAVHETYTFKSGITLAGVMELRSFFPDGTPFERYFYSSDTRVVGLVGWRSETPGQNLESYISAILPASTPNLSREKISWINLPYSC